ncbi:MAG: hypothetical protein E6R03_17740 [Hyphomicrobiaceae bacterium]|nr:MAG: hypothetical protein E6R03_17740 [Hyphomicrobiaceae bacterium]
MKWKLTLDDIVTVLQRKGYRIESQPTKVPGRNGKGKYVDVLYAHLPGHIYGFRLYCPENTAEAVFSKLMAQKGGFTKDDYLNSL